MAEGDEDDNKSDISWRAFFAFSVLFMLAGYAFDEAVRPMRGVHPAEMILWYVGYGPGFLLITALPIALLHSIGKRRGVGMKRPKRTALIAGAILMAFTLAMSARHYA